MTDKLWFKEFIASQECDFMRNHPVVYFCAEYALLDTLPIYAGGLGILAGDIIREAAEQKIPFLAIGLFYMNSGISNLQPVTDKQNNRIIVTLPVKDTFVAVQAWSLQIGNVFVYLLDTNIPQNEEKDRYITEQLYSSNKEVRFKQEMVLGLGGPRLLEALQISPIGYHLNEGHSALLTLEIVRHEKLKNVKQHIFFTNHTLVPADNDTFNVDLVSTLLSGFAKELKIPVDEIINLGLITGSGLFSTTLLALRMAGKVNAVSQLHAQKAREIWKEFPMIPITNGIHIKTWDCIENKENMWQKHQNNKRLLLEYVRTKTGVAWDENTLLLGWARRIVEYKRPLALLENLQQFKNLASMSNKPIRVIFSGLCHKSDAKGLVILEKMKKIIAEDLKGIAVYLPDYSMSKAKLLVSGCDVWLNTPVVGFEACGTSGMKAALNGVLPCSTADGWVAEANMYEVGWLLQDKNVSEDILSVLQQQIVPLFYDRDNQGVPQEWVKMMQNARDMTLNQFNTTKTLREYIEKFYLPVIRINQTKTY